MKTELANTLNVLENKELRKCEATIEEGKKTFIEVGNALATIRDKKLYRASHRTFEAYTKARWGYAKSRAYQLIEAAGVTSEMSTIVDISKGKMSPIGDKTGNGKSDDDYKVVPANEAQARILKEVPADERAEVLAEAAERNDGKPTVAAIREVIAEREEEEAEEEPTFEESIDEENKLIESFCRSLVKFYEENVPQLTWTQADGRIDSALAAVRSGCNTLRAAKAVVCPACDEGQTKRGKCGYCKGHGYLPTQMEKAIPQEVRL